jgi:orotidine-5'-phosphate decarboxylase
MSLPFSEALTAAVRRTRTPLCVGIDPWPDRLPWPGLGTDRRALAARAEGFGLAVVRAVAGEVPAVKPQFAFFEQLGAPGMAALERVCHAAREAGLLVVADAKRGDIGTTAAAYAAAVFGPDAPFPADALTISPFLGPDSLTPFVDAADRHGGGLFVLLRTSNPGSARWQAPVRADLTRWLAENAALRTGSDHLSPLGAVVGATHPGELAEARAALPTSWLLVPGYGAQGGTAADVAPAARPDGLGALIVSARGATFPDRADPAWAADPEPWIRARVWSLVADVAAAWPEIRKG